MILMPLRLPSELRIWTLIKLNQSKIYLKIFIWAEFILDIIVFTWNLPMVGKRTVVELTVSEIKFMKKR